ncbi:MAG: DUF6282 family protein [Phycisphaerae bacterium]|jgi:hypothetical protein
MDIAGAIDLHVHSSPDVYERSVDDVELVREAAAAGMRAVLLKSHHTLTADRATLAAKQVAGLEVFGGMALNLTVGGLNPVAVETAIAFGARQVWMPTLHAAHCLEVGELDMFRAEARKGREGIRVVDADGKLRPEVSPVLEQIRDADIALGTGHLAPEESLTLLGAARDMGITRTLVTHPLAEFTRFDVDQMKAAAALGALLEFDYLSCSPRQPATAPPSRTARAIHAVGHDHCILATDGGQAFNPRPARMLREFAEALLAEGVGEDEIRLMMCANPARILKLE